MTVSERESMHRPILPREKWWWLGLALLLLLAGWLYYRGYNLSLPYIDHVDEPQHLLAAQHIIDEGHARAVGHEAYPPGTNQLAYLLLKHVKPPEAHHFTMKPALRLITITAWIAVVVVIALLGAMAGHRLTGLLAAAIWVVNPWVVGRTHFLLPDGYLTLFTLLSLWLALVACSHRKPSFNTAAVYSLMLAIVFKTQAILLAPLVLFPPLLDIWRAPQNRHEALKQVFWNCVRFGFFLFWLLLIFPTLEIDSIPTYPVTEKRLVMPSPALLWSSLRPVLLTFQPLGIWLGLAICGVYLWRFGRRINTLASLYLLLAAVAFWIGMNVLPFHSNQIRQYFVLGALLSMLAALALTSLLFGGQRLLTRLGLPRESRLRWLAPLSLCALVALALLPSYQKSDFMVHGYTLHDRRNDLAVYFDISLPPALTVAHAHMYNTFNRSWHGYTGVHDIPMVPGHAWLYEKPIEDWRALGVEYAIMPHSLMLENPDIYYPDETTLLKTYPVDSNFRGPDMVVLRLYPMQHTHGGQLGPIRLLGYDISATTLQAGEELALRHYWQAQRPTDSPQHVFNHLLDENGAIVAQADYVPLWDNRRDSTTWDDPDEIMLGREFTLSTPPDLAPGVYKLVSGLYDPETWQRLGSPDGGDRLVIAEIRIAAPAP